MKRPWRVDDTSPAWSSSLRWNDIAVGLLPICSASSPEGTPVGPARTRSRKILKRCSCASAESAATICVSSMALYFKDCCSNQIELYDDLDRFRSSARIARMLLPIRFTLVIRHHCYFCPLSPDEQMCMSAYLTVEKGQKQSWGHRRESDIIPDRRRPRLRANRPQRALTLANNECATCQWANHGGCSFCGWLPQCKLKEATQAAAGLTFDMSTSSSTARGRCSAAITR
jgi:hypothetical protein